VSDPAGAGDRARAVGDHRRVIARLRDRLVSDAPARLAIAGHRPAAVAVLLVERDAATWLPFTVRTRTLRAHSGQISFPGGVVDPCDDSLAACALREAHEELAVDHAHIDVLGELDDIVTPTGFTITPVVAELRLEGARYRPNPAEVAEVFEAPLQVFTDPSIVEHMGEREYLGRSYRLHAYRVGEHRIWGATARIVEQLLDKLG
jgi:8-oxo-dGTP pyrophosphatase MutT (NUDIX family)